MVARKKNAAQDNGPHSAPHTPPAAPPAPIPAPPADSPAAAVWAALAAAPGATAAQIAAATGTTRIAAGRELAALETSGLATRTPGTRTSRTSAPATWQSMPPAVSATAPAGPGQALPAGTVGLEGSPAAAASGSLPVGPAPDEADGSPPDTDVTASTGTGILSTDETTPAPADGRLSPSPAGEAAVLLRDVAGKAAAAGDALDDGDTAAALAGMDAICAAAAQSRRLLRAAASGRRLRGAVGPATRPGQLRDLVQAHLAAHPDAEFTPHVIGRVLGRSSGAVANALDRLTALGHAQLTSDKPRRYRHQAATASTPAPAGTTA